MMLALADNVVSRLSDVWDARLRLRYQPPQEAMAFRRRYADLAEAAKAERYRGVVNLANHWLLAGVPKAEVSRRMIGLHLAMQWRSYRDLPTSMLWDQDDPNDFWGTLSETKWKALCAEYDGMTPSQRQAKYDT